MDRPRSSFRRLFAVVVLLFVPLAGETLNADEIRVAAASNFRDTLKEISALFEQQSGIEVVLIFGSTGKHYAQLLNGAPYDLFFAADAARPQKLESRGLALPGRRYTYAIGRLALWDPEGETSETVQARIMSGDYRRLAMANPELAPYGRAAKQALLALGLWRGASSRVVTGENVAQAYQFAASGNADLGFVARAQLERSPAPAGSWWLVPVSHHDPIEQQVVQLTDKPAAGRFFDFARSAEALEIIRLHGYALPDDL